MGVGRLYLSCERFLGRYLKTVSAFDTTLFVFVVREYG